MRFIAGLLIVSLVFTFSSPVFCADLSSMAIDNSSSDSSTAISGLSEATQVSIDDNYKLGISDQIAVNIIVGENALVLNYQFIINPEGKIYFPNLGEIELAGLSLKQAKQEIAKFIGNKYKEPINLSLMVQTPKKINVYVTGQISEPGLYAVYDGTTTAQILKKVGVAKGGSDLSESVYLQRKTSSSEVTEYKFKLTDVFFPGSKENNQKLENGDIISVPAIKSYIYVYGDVARSGTYGYVPGQNLSDYINLAGGPSPKANLSGVTVTREEKGQAKVYHINATDILQKGLAKNDIVILPGDVIFVPGNFFYFSDFGTFANTVLLALTLYSTLVR